MQQNHILKGGENKSTVTFDVPINFQSNLSIFKGVIPMASKTELKKALPTTITENEEIATPQNPDPSKILTPADTEERQEEKIPVDDLSYHCKSMTFPEIQAYIREKEIDLLSLDASQLEFITSRKKLVKLDGFLSSLREKQAEMLAIMTSISSSLAGIKEKSPDLFQSAIDEMRSTYPALLPIEYRLKSAKNGSNGTGSQHPKTTYIDPETGKKDSPKLHKLFLDCVDTATMNQEEITKKICEELPWRAVNEETRKSFTWLFSHALRTENKISPFNHLDYQIVKTDKGIFKRA